VLHPRRVAIHRLRGLARGFLLSIRSHSA
jgi:hypothetical protein